MPTLYKGEECLTLDEMQIHMHQFVRESAKEIPSLLKKRQQKLENYELSI